ncbi:MAG TPA: aldo/keto reductase [Acidimicrobiales bacterium]|nr:aldo/keto reductase [Acidimicrobiales bacterium]
MSIPRAPFGRTGHESTRVIFGGAALSQVSQAEADATYEVLVEAGVNHLDIAAGYGDAELRVRPWLERSPGHFFLATKTGERKAGPAREQLERSLQRMGVDHVDLWQLHNLVDPIEWDTALSPGGALETAIAAREEGLVRFIGVTGHGTQVAATHRRSLERFDFDSVLLPYNYVTMKNPYYASNFEALLATCAERRAAVQTIKAVAAAPWRGREHTYAPWYMPLSDQADIDLAVWWALGRPGIFLDSVSDIGLLPKYLSAASRFSARPDDSEMEAMLERSHVEPLFV